MAVSEPRCSNCGGYGHMNCGITMVWPPMFQHSMGWICPRCQQSNSPHNLTCPCGRPGADGGTGMSNPADSCPCNPSRGGSGICGCILNSGVTCYVTS